MDYLRNIVAHSGTWLCFFTREDRIHMIAAHNSVTVLHVDALDGFKKFAFVLGLTVECDSESEHTCIVRSDPALSRWPPGLIDFVASYIRLRVSLLTIDAEGVSRLTLSF
jgi:hypothetical protein